MKWVLVLSLLLLSSGASRAEESVADLKAANSAILAKSPKADGVFVVQDDATIRHIQSGLVCRARFPNVELYALLVFSSEENKGQDVGCDYIRHDDKGGADAKLTIFATEAPDTFTVAQAFARYRNEVMQADPEAVSLGESLRIENKGNAPDNALARTQSEEFKIFLNQRDYTSQLYVTISRGWIIEVRTTFTGLPNAIVVTKEGGTAEAAAEAGDRLMGPAALVDAIASIGK